MVNEVTFLASGGAIVPPWMRPWAVYCFHSFQPVLFHLRCIVSRKCPSANETFQQALFNKEHQHASTFAA